MSVVVTSLLLIVAVGMIGSFLLAWSNSTFAIQQFTIANQTANRINLAKESFVVEDVWFYNSGGKKADITIRNTGDLAITISKVYINNTQAWIPVITQWGSGDAQAIQIQTARGSQAKQLWKS
jgi:archaellum component FlaF (FlaF/FlaG flagellin family)